MTTLVSIRTGRTSPAVKNCSEYGQNIYSVFFLSWHLMIKTAITEFGSK